MAGNNEPATLFSAIANKHPENTYVLIGKSDFSRCNKEYIDYWFKHGNVIDACEFYQNSFNKRKKKCTCLHFFFFFI